MLHREERVREKKEVERGTKQDNSKKNMGIIPMFFLYLADYPVTTR
jgi:hypothetical protein